MELKSLNTSKKTKYYDYGPFRVALYKHQSGPWVGRLSLRKGPPKVVSFPTSEFRATEGLIKKYIDESITLKAKEIVRLLFTR